MGSVFVCTQMREKRAVLFLSEFRDNIYYIEFIETLEKDERRNVVTYNILNEPWLQVRYLNGEVCKVGVKQALKDAHLIAEITPIHKNGTAYWIYDVVDLWLLCIIVMASYPKTEDTDGAYDEEYLEELWNSETLFTSNVDSYLEAFADRFDLFDEVHPFLQDVSLKDKLSKAMKNKEQYDFVSKFNPFAPGDTTAVFGSVREGGIGEENSDYLKRYRIKPDEAVHIVLYRASLALSPMPAKYVASLGSNAKTFAMLKGKTLKETIVANCVRLDDKRECRPIWEYASLEEIKGIDSASLYSSVLFTTFAASSPILLGSELDNDGNILYGVAKQKSEIVDWSQEAFKNHEELYICHNPWTVKDVIKDEKTKEDKEVFFKFRVGKTGKNEQTDTSPISLIMAATKRLGGRMRTPVIGRLRCDSNLKNCALVFYYRTRPEKFSFVYATGKIEASANSAVLLSDKRNSMLAQRYQTAVLRANAKLRDSLKCLSLGMSAASANGTHGRSSNGEISKRILNEFNAWVATDFFTCFIEDIEASEDACLEKAEERIRLKMYEMFEKQRLRASSAVAFCRARQKLGNGFLLKKEEMDFGDSEDTDD